jgi:hypothetical protein
VSSSAGHVVTLRPGADPLVALAGAFDPPPADAGRTRQLEYLNDTAACLRDDRVGLRQLAGPVLATLPESAGIPPGRGPIYTQAGRGDDAARFVALILELAEAERVHGVLLDDADVGYGDGRIAFLRRYLGAQDRKFPFPPNAGVVNVTVPRLVL